jgi:hypothetical protein
LPFQSFSRHHEEDIIANSYCKNDFRFRLKNISCLNSSAEADNFKQH